jgi:hypothetical protein
MDSSACFPTVDDGKDDIVADDNQVLSQAKPCVSDAESNVIIKQREKEALFVIKSADIVKFLQHVQQCKQQYGPR